MKEIAIPGSLQAAPVVLDVNVRIVFDYLKMTKNSCPSASP
jgi:hypothetical protein